jgi:hypothetical protein
MNDQLDPNAIAKRLYEFSQDYADTKAAFELLSEMKKPKLYSLAHECNESSAAAKEAYAYRHPDYAAYIKVMVEAEKVMLRAKGKLEAERARIDLLRTKAASEREVNRNLP